MLVSIGWEGGIMYGCSGGICSADSITNHSGTKICIVCTNSCGSTWNECKSVTIFLQDEYNTSYDETIYQIQ
jgi:hypothetical protein